VPPTRIRHGDGSWHWIEGVANNLLAEPGVQAIVVNFRDITERKQAEEELRRRAEELERINAELERFNRLAVGREQRMIELKRQVNALAEALGQAPPYDLSFVESRQRNP